MHTSTLSPIIVGEGIVIGQDLSHDGVAEFFQREGYHSYIKLASLQAYRNYSTTEAPESPPGAPVGLALVIVMVSVAVAIAIIALLINKMRRRQTPEEDMELEIPTDPYLQAIMFPTEPRPEWHRHLRQVLQKAGQKIFKKPEHHDTNIPENLRYQLKQIYVY
ncbi:uncharacterized protein [Macrobrachium rosenbergii]|uniref:uncharacterized protein isoform X2 n=1 Tax=Macrobrachium rosenbergii TaxID=79674 RepID=UPI0034D62B34